MGQQYSALADGTSAATSSHNASSGSRTKVENTDPSQAWGSNISSAVSSTPGRSELEIGEHSNHKPKLENELSRMSIRAAIDTFIENCLSAHNDYTPQTDDKPENESHSNTASNSLSEDIDDNEKTESESSRSINVNPSTDGTENELNSTKAVDVQNNDADDEHKNTETKDLVIEKTLLENENKCQIKDSKDGHLDSGICSPQPVLEIKLVENIQKNPPNELSPGTSNTPALCIQPKTEKQTFSAYLQERLKTIDLDKHEELTRLAMNKDIQCQGQMFMWEMTKKPADGYDISSQSTAQSISTFTSGPVRLQTVIDRVLDNSLRKPDQPANIGYIKKKDDGITQEQDMIKTPSVLLPPEITPRTQKEPSEINVSDPTKTRLCFKDHIEKVLLESFLSFEEDERREALKTEGRNDKATSETHSGETNSSKGGNSRSNVDTDDLTSNEGGNKALTDSDRLGIAKGGNRARVETDRLSGNDGTISVQDIVDQVISQTEMISELRTSSARDTSKLTPSSGQSDISGQSSGLSTQSNSGPKFPISSHNRALVEAQRHAVQKEHQSSTNLGRKRGRPRLGSPVNTTSKCPPEPFKDLKSSYQDMRNGQMSSYTNDHSHTMIPSRDYILTNHLPSGIPGGLSSKSMVPSATTMFQQNHQLIQNSQSSYTVKKFLTGSTSAGYQLNPHDGFHQQRVGQHMHSHPQPQQHQPRPHDGGQIPSSNPPSPHILADRVKENSRLVPVSHIPTKSCSCHSCLAHFSKVKSPPQVIHIQQHMHHPVSKMDSSGEHAQHPSIYQRYPPTSSHMNSTDFYTQPVHVNKETSNSGITLPSHSILPTFLTAQRQKKDTTPHPASKESVADGHFISRDYSPVIYQQHQGHMPQTSVKPILLDPRFVATNNGIQTEHLIYEEDSFQRIIRDKDIHSDTPDGSKVKEVPLGASMSQDIDQPLDLSVKPCPAHNQDTRTYSESDTESPRQDTEFCVKRSYYRQSSSNLHSVGDGQYMEYEQQGASGHHLQKLENSVDRFLFHRHSQPQLHLSLYSDSPQIMQQRQKTQLLHAAHQTQQDGHGVLHSHPSQDHHYLETLSQDQGASGHRTNHHHHHYSPVSLAHSSSPALQQLPLMSQPQQHQNSAESPSSGQYQTRSPGLSLRQNLQKNIDTPQHLQPDQSSTNHTLPFGAASAAIYQHNPESKDEETTTTDSTYVSSPAHPHPSPSPEDNQKLNLSKQEPIQNIIGNHPPSDILYLICLLCRQTYGSPYGFRKHFRNQHGFEPKADHTIVQTISATKTARAHTGPSDVTKKPLESQFIKDDKFQNDHLYFHGQSMKSSPAGSIAPPSSQPSLKNTASSDDSNSEMIKELPMTTKCLECPECNQTFQLNDFGSYKRHCRQHSLHRSSGPFACHECERSFSEPSFLQEHLATHSSFTPSVCGICRTFFSSPSYLADHLQAAHGIVNGSESRQRELSKPSDSTKKLEFLSVPAVSSGTNTINRSASFPDFPVSPATLNQTGTSSTVGHSSTPLILSAAPSPLQRSPAPSTLGHSAAQTPLHQSATPSPLGYSATPSTASHSVTPSPVGHRSVPSPVGHSSAPPTVDHSVTPRLSQSVTLVSEQPVLSRYPSTSSMTHVSPFPKHPHNLNTLNRTPHMITFHTPKGLEIQKLPADAVVTAASPDSSYDEGKLRLDFQTTGNILQADTVSDKLETIKDGRCESSCLYPENKTSIVNTTPRKTDTTNKQKCDKREETESNSSDRSTSVESVNFSLDQSHSSVQEENEIEKFYQHKKYSRQRKRVTSSDINNEPKTKSRKGEDSSDKKDQLLFLVSSSANSSVTIQDCESSCSISEDSNLNLKGKKPEDKLLHELNKLHKQEEVNIESKGNKTDQSRSNSNVGDNSSKYEEVGAQFKWDRQTRSLTGKSTQPISYTQ